MAELFKTVPPGRLFDDEHREVFMTNIVVRMEGRRRRKPWQNILRIILYAIILGLILTYWHTVFSPLSESTKSTKQQHQYKITPHDKPGLQEKKKKVCYYKNNSQACTTNPLVTAN